MSLGYRKLGRNSAQRKALRRDLITDLILNGQIETTLYKAKELQRLADEMVTLGKKGDENNNNLNENQISNNTQQENEMDALMFLLKKAFEEGYDLFTGSGLTMDEKMQLRSLLKLEMCADLGENEEEDEDNLSDNLDIGNQIVSLIELDVNELFLNKMINNVKIDQINAFNYSFEDFRVSKDVKLKIENNVLYTENDVKFTDWLLEFFGTKNSV